jgi:uncharacterized protein HemX
MAKLYTEVLEKHGLKDADLSVSLKKLVRDYKKGEAFIAQCQTKMEAAKTDAKKQQLQTTIKEGNDNLQELNTYLVEAIEKWLPNREKNKAKGAALAAARKNGGKKADPAPATTVAVTKKDDEPETKPTKKLDPPAPAASGDDEPPKKTKWGVVAGVLVALLLGVAGIGYYQSQKQTV